MELESLLESRRGRCDCSRGNGWGGINCRSCGVCRRRFCCSSGRNDDVFGELRVLDLCTGSGAVAIAVYKELEKSRRKANVTAADVSGDALALARENAETNGADVTFVQSDLFSRIRGRYNIIVSNPPYIPTKDIEGLQREVREFEPRLALDGGEDGLDFYRRIAQEAGKYLVRGGMLIMEVGMGEAEDVVKLFKYCDYAMIVKDMQGVDRFVKIVV